MPEFIVEMRWRCDTCHDENLGRYKECQGCGKPKGRESFYAPGTAPPTLAQAVTDAALIAQARAGVDWECRYCRSHQRRDSGECANCGASQGEARPAAPAATTDSADAMIRALQGPRWLPSRRRLALAGGAALLALLVLYLVLRPRIIDARVTATSWEHHVHVDRYQIVRSEGFDPPGGAFDIADVGMRHHHYKQVQTGTREESYQEEYACGTTPRVCTPTPQTCRTTPVSCTDNGNGFQTCRGGDEVCSSGGEQCSGGDTKYCNRTQYRTVPVYTDVSVEKMFRRWKAWEWKLHRTISERGQSEPPRWPADERLNLGKDLGPEAKEERARREGRYRVVLRDDDGDEHEVQPSNEAAFLALPMGATRKLRVGVGRDPQLVADP